jgi:hypothetical protein
MHPGFCNRMPHAMNVRLPGISVFTLDMARSARRQSITICILCRQEYGEKLVALDQKLTDTKEQLATGNSHCLLTSSLYRT